MVVVACRSGPGGAHTAHRTPPPAAAQPRLPLRLAALALLGAAAGVTAQPLSMRLCVGDTTCSSLCTSWSTSVGACAVCSGGHAACSPSNPSSVTSRSGITFYADGACSAGANTTAEIPLIVDGSFACRQLSPLGGSYVATDLTGLIAGVTVGGVVFLALVITGIVFCCRARGNCAGCCCGAPPPRAGGVITKAPPASVSTLPGATATEGPPGGFTAPQLQPRGY